MLSAVTYYNFSVVYSIHVDPKFQSRIPSSEGLFFKEGTNNAVSINVTTLYLQHTYYVHTIHLQSIKILGDDEALSPSYNITVDVQSHQDYIGAGAINVTIVDDDRK